MKDDALIELASANHGLATTPLVRVAGLSSDQWLHRRNGEWCEGAPGVWYHRATVLTWEMRLRAGLIALGDDAAAAGWAAAAWWQFDGFEPSTVEFVVPRRRRDDRWLTVHTTREWAKSDLVVHAGLRVTSATRTIIDLATWGCPARLLEKAIDSAVRMRWTSVPTLSRRMDELARRGFRGVRLLRELLLDSGGESQLERRFLRLLCEHRLPRPACQVVHAREGGRAMRVDFQFEGRLVVEVSGRVGHASDRDRQKDVRRRNTLAQHGFEVREFTTADVLDDPDYVLSTVAAALSGRDSTGRGPVESRPVRR